MPLATEQQIRLLPQRALRGLCAGQQAAIVESYRRLQPVLLLLMRPRDIMERNRTWPGVRPVGKGATTYLIARETNRARDIIDAYAAGVGEDADALYALFRAYCRYGPIGLFDAVPSQLPPLIPNELQECAEFHRLGKHPRSDAGIYIRELLDKYAEELGFPPLPAFVSRYAWATDRRIERWFFGETGKTEHVAKTTRRLNLDQPYPHQRWLTRMAPLAISCLLSRRHQVLVEPWLIWMIDEHTNTLMGFRISPSRPEIQDVWLTFRWSIWHYDAPWWKSRGVPDQIAVPSDLAMLNGSSQRALMYTRTSNQSADIPDMVPMSLSTDSTTGLPEKFTAWLDLQARRLSVTQIRRITLAEIQMMLLDLVCEAMGDDVVARSTPTILADQACSLPWSTGLAAALLMPSAGHYPVSNGRVAPWGIPYDLVETGVADGAIVDVRYDPDDARHVFVIFDGAHVAKAAACAFEHRIMWLELVEHPTVLW